MFLIKKTFSILIMTLLFLGSFFFVGNGNVHNQQNYFSYNITSAQSTGSGTTNTTTSDKTSDAFNKIITILNSLAGIMVVIITPLVVLAGWMMSPDWTTGDVFGLREPIYNLWIFVSNLVYIAYAVLLILIALGTMFNQKNFSYKVLLPRLFLGVILVPFTWWFVQFMISASTVITTSFVSLPMETVDKMQINKTWFDQKIIPKVITNETMNTAVGKIANNCNQDPDKCTSPKAVIEKSGGIYGSLLVYAYGIFRIQEIKEINTSGIDVAKNIIHIFDGLLIELIMFFIFGLLTIALLTMLFVRFFWVLIYTIISPLFTFRFVLKDIWKQDDYNININDFIGAVFLPAIIGLVLGLGLIVMGTLQSVLNTTKPTTGTAIATEKDGMKIITLFGNPNNYIAKGYQVEESKNENETQMIGEIKNDAKSCMEGGKTCKTVITANFGDFKIRHIGGKASQGDKVDTGISSNSKDFAGYFVSIIVKFIALGFLWIAFMAASKTAKIVATVIAPFAKIKDSVTEVGRAAAGATPVPVFGNITGINKGLQNISRSIQSNIDTKYENSAFGKSIKNEQPSEAANDANKKFQNTAKGDTKIDINNKTEITNHINTQVDEIKKANSQPKKLDTGTNMLESFRKFKDNKHYNNDKDKFENDVKEYLEAYYKTKNNKTLTSDSAEKLAKLIAENGNLKDTLKKDDKTIKAFNEVFGTDISKN